MSDRERFLLLQDRLRARRLAIVPPWQRTIQLAGSEAIEAELTELGRRLRRSARPAEARPAAQRAAG
jgi:hypothetical protein